MRILVIKNKDLILFQKERLIEACDDNPESSLRKLFIYSYSIKIEEYIYYLDRQVNEKKYKYFCTLIDRRIKGEPISHITGVRYFWKDEFIVSSDVLDPRPESELIVEIGREFLIDGASVLDIGSGSGCVGLSLLRENPNIQLTLSDISNSSIVISEKNAKKLRMKCKIIYSNLFENIKNKFNLIVCNLPYIKRSDLMYLSSEVILFEPHEALIGGEVGLELIYQFLNKVSFYLVDNGAFIFEIGIDQIDAIVEKLNVLEFSDYQIFPDINGISRTVCVQKDTKIGYI